MFGGPGREGDARQEETGEKGSVVIYIYIHVVSGG